MQVPAAPEQPAADRHRASLHAVDTQVLSVECELDDPLQQARSWRLEEPADELSMSPGQQRPEQAPVLRAVHPEGHDANINHTLEDLWRPHAGGFRPRSHGAWPGVWPESRGSCGDAASTAPWLETAATAPRSQRSVCLPDDTQLAEVHLPAVCHSAGGQPILHAQPTVGSRGSSDLVPEMASIGGAHSTLHGIEDSRVAAGSSAVAADTYGAGQSDGSILAANQESVLGMPPHMHRHAGSTAGSGGSMAPTAALISSAGHVPASARPAASRAQHQLEHTCDSAAILPDHAMLATGQASTAAHVSGLGSSQGSVPGLSSIRQSPGPQAAGIADASTQGVVPDQERQLSSSTAPPSAMAAPAKGQHGAPQLSLAVLQPASDNGQDAADLGCFAEHCGAAMQVCAGEAIKGRPGSAAALGRHAVAASSSLQEVAESRSVWMQLSAVMSEADGILEDASSSCGGSSRSRSSCSGQAGHHSPRSAVQSSAHEEAIAAFSGKHESASSSGMQSSMLPAEDANMHAVSAIGSAHLDSTPTLLASDHDGASCSHLQSSMTTAEATSTHAALAIQSDAGHEQPALGAGHSSLGHVGMARPASAAAPAAEAASAGDAHPLHGCLDAPALQGSQPGPPSSGAARLRDMLRSNTHLYASVAHAWDMPRYNL